MVSSSESSPFLNTENTENRDNIDPNQKLRELKKNNFGRLIIGHLNINSLRNKFEALKTIVKGKVDILMVSETKIDDSFPMGQFAIAGFANVFRLDRDHEGGGIIIYVRDDIPCKELKNHSLPHDIEGIFIEINLRKTKWVLFGGYNPKKERISYFLNHVGQSLDKYIGNYDNILLLGDYNSEVIEEKMRDFCDIYNLANLIKEHTCYESVLKPTSIDVILTNRINSFENSHSIKTGISDYHKMTVTVLKTFFKKSKPTYIKYRECKKFDVNLFKTELAHSMQENDAKNMNYDKFRELFMIILNKHAPLKEKKQCTFYEQDII